MSYTGLFDGRLVRFLAVGAANTCVGLGFILAAKRWGQLGDVAANLMGYGVALTLSFVMNKAWTFKSQGRTLPELRRFLVVAGIAYAANLATVVALIRLGLDGYWAQVAGVPPYTIVFYLGSRVYAFTGHDHNERQP